MPLSPPGTCPKSLCGDHPSGPTQPLSAPWLPHHSPLARHLQHSRQHWDLCSHEKVTIQVLNDHLVTCLEKVCQLQRDSVELGTKIQEVSKCQESSVCLGCQSYFWATEELQLKVRFGVVWVGHFGSEEGRRA